MLMSNNIGNLLLQRGLTVYGLAKRTGLTYVGVKKLVDSDEIPASTHYDTLRRIAQELDVSIEDLED